MSTPSNWQKYLDLLFQKRIPEQYRRWYVKRVEDFLKEHPGKSLREFSASDLEAYFQLRSRDTSLTAWQYRQMVDALQLLFVDLVATSLAKTLDWGYWKEAFVQLKPEKTYLSKEIGPDVDRINADLQGCRINQAKLQRKLLKTKAKSILAPQVSPSNSKISSLKSPIFT
jgi:hypothetical protein